MSFTFLSPLIVLVVYRVLDVVYTSLDTSYTHLSNLPEGDPQKDVRRLRGTLGSRVTGITTATIRG